jgi:transposase InsO family protein
VTPASPGGRHYFLLLIDDVYQYMWVVILGTKGATTDAIKHVQAAAENESRRELRVLRMDNSSEFTSTEFASYCTDEGIQRHFSTPYSSQ